MDTTLLNVTFLTCCVRLCTLLHDVLCCGCVLLGVVVQSLKTVKLLSQQLPTFLLFHIIRDCQSTTLLLFQHCWGQSHTLHMVSKVSHVWVVSFPQHALQVPTLLGVNVASVCTPLPKRTQQILTLSEAKCMRGVSDLDHSLNKIVQILSLCIRR